MNRLAACLLVLLAFRYPALSGALVRFALVVVVHLPGLVVPLLSLALAGMTLTVAVMVVLIVRQFREMPGRWAWR